MNRIESSPQQTEQPKSLRIVDSIFQFLEDWEDPNFIIEELQRLKTINPHLKKSIEDDIRQRIPINSDINLELLGIYLTNKAFEQIEEHEAKEIDYDEMEPYLRPEDRRPRINFFSSNQLQLGNLPIQSTPEEYADIEEKKFTAEKIRQKRSEAAKKRWQDPEYRIRVIESRRAKQQLRKAEQSPRIIPVAEMTPGETYEIKPEAPQPLKNPSNINSEDMELWQYAVENDLLEKIVSNGYLSKEEMLILTNYFKGEAAKKQALNLLDRFSIAVAWEA